MKKWNALPFRPKQSYPQRQYRVDTNNNIFRDLLLKNTEFSELTSTYIDIFRELLLKDNTYSKSAKSLYQIKLTFPEIYCQITRLFQSSYRALLIFSDRKLQRNNY